MNKKKFLATCTLVAFGSTMLPAMAFATEIDYPHTPSSKLALDGTVLTVALNADWANPNLGGFRVLDLTDDQQIIAEAKDTETTLGSASEDEIVVEYTAVASDDNDTIVFAAGAKVDAGHTYQLTNGDGSKRINVITAVPTNITTNIASATNATAGNFDPAKAGALTIGSGGVQITQDDVIFAIDGENGRISSTARVTTASAADGLTAGETATLTIGQWYGVVATADAGSVQSGDYPAKQFQYTEKVAGDVAAAIKKANEAKSETEKVLAERLAAIPSTVTVNVGSDAKTLATVFNEYLLDFETVNAIAQVFDPRDGLENYVTDSTGKIDVAIVGADNKDVTGKITVQVASNGVIDEKDVTVTLHKVTAVDENDLVAAYAEANLSTGDKLTLSKGDSIVLPTDLEVIAGTTGKATPVKVTIKTVAGRKAFTDAVDKATGEIVADSDEDLTGIVTLEFAGTASATQTINLTIKAASGDPAVEELREAALESAKSYKGVVDGIMAKGEIALADLDKADAALADFLKAYKAYQDALNAQA